MRRLCLIALLLCAQLWAQDHSSLNIALMRSTFLLQGQGANGKPTIGTGFLLMRPFSGQDSKAPTITGRYVLVTAGHVLNEMVGDDAFTYLRLQQGTSSAWSVVPVRFKIRHNGQPLWKQNPNADVAVIYVRPPFDPVGVAISTTMLANDATLKGAGVGPGAELKNLGFPLGDSSSGAFPILRTGVIASYPLFPTTETKTFLFDFRVFKGNSGGPVYFSDTEIQGGAILCCKPQFIVGLVSQEHLFSVPVDEVYETGTKNLQLSLAVVVHASLILQTIEMLPLPESSAAEAITVSLEPVQAPQGH